MEALQVGEEFHGYLNMSDDSHSCPHGFLTRDVNGFRACGRLHSGSYNCLSTYYNYTSGFPYNKVCGRIRGYQLGRAEGFSERAHIAAAYVDGVSLTHGYGEDRTHIWTFAVGLSETYSGNSNDDTLYCPCMLSGATQPPSFVGDDYFCESGNQLGSLGHHNIYSDDPLWDGQQCTLTCCQNEYFMKTLPAQTSDDIELRICGKERPDYDDVLIYEVELYVQ